MTESACKFSTANRTYGSVCTCCISSRCVRCECESFCGNCFAAIVTYYSLCTSNCTCGFNNCFSCILVCTNSLFFSKSNVTVIHTCNCCPLNSVLSIIAEYYAIHYECECVCTGSCIGYIKCKVVNVTAFICRLFFTCCEVYLVYILICAVLNIRDVIACCSEVCKSCSGSISNIGRHTGFGVLLIICVDRVILKACTLCALNDLEFTGIDEAKLNTDKTVLSKICICTVEAYTNLNCVNAGFNFYVINEECELFKCLICVCGSIGVNLCCNRTLYRSSHNFYTVSVDAGLTVSGNNTKFE